MEELTGKVSKAQKIGGAIAQSMLMASPVLRRAANVSSAFEATPDGSRLGNAGRSFKEYAMGQSRMLQTLASIKNFVKDLFEDEEKAEKAKEKTPRSTNTHGVNDHLNKEESPLIVAFDQQKLTLEKILDTLVEQLKYTKDLFRIGIEASETEKLNSEFGKVSSGAYVAPNVLAGEAANENKPIAMNPESPGAPAEKEGFSLADLAVGGAATVGTLGIIRSGFSKLKSGVGAVSSGLLSAGKNIGGKVANAFSAAVKSPVIPKVFGAAKTGIKDGLRGIMSRAPNLLSRMPNIAASASRFALGTALGPVAAIMTPSELESDPQEKFKNSIYKQLEEGGMSALPSVAEMLNSEQGKFMRENFPEYDYEILANPEVFQDEAAEIAKAFYKAKENPTRQNAADVFYGDTNQLINKAIQDYSKDSDGSLLSPDGIRNKIANSPTALRMQSNLNMITNSNVKPTTSNPTATIPPIIVGKQGGVTNVNNGGNVTNIIHGSDSLALPQMQFNLPSGIH